METLLPSIDHARAVRTAKHVRDKGSSALYLPVICCPTFRQNIRLTPSVTVVQTT